MGWILPALLAVLEKVLRALLSPREVAAILP
jgi:hypothetical protein